MKFVLIGLLALLVLGCTTSTPLKSTPSPTAGVEPTVKVNVQPIESQKQLCAQLTQAFMEDAANFGVNLVQETLVYKNKVACKIIQNRKTTGAIVTEGYYFDFSGDMEKLRTGEQCVTSKTNSLPEVCGATAEKVREELEKLMQDPAQVAKTQERALNDLLVQGCKSAFEYSQACTENYTPRKWNSSARHKFEGNDAQCASVLVNLTEYACNVKDSTCVCGPSPYKTR